MDRRQNFHDMFRGLDQIASGNEIEDQIQQIVSDADKDKSGSLDLEEFAAWYRSVYVGKLDREAKIQFDKIDFKSCGFIDISTLKAHVQTV